jgi:hypothetical protein
MYPQIPASFFEHGSERPCVVCMYSSPVFGSERGGFKGIVSPDTVFYFRVHKIKAVLCIVPERMKNIFKPASMKRLTISADFTESC